MRWPSPAPDALDSRAATDALLAGLRAGGWRPTAWGRFIARSAARSAQQARGRPRATFEVTLLHGGLALVATRRRWVAASWALAVTHLGLLGSRRDLGAANILTLARANLPAVAAPGSRWPLAVALASDALDGRLARRRGNAGGPTSFGGYADTFADTAFWTWYAARYEPSPVLQATTLAAWAGPVFAVAVASLARGRMVDAPRPVRVRPAAALQVLLAARALRDGRVGAEVGVPVRRLTAVAPRGGRKPLTRGTGTRPHRTWVMMVYDMGKGIDRWARQASGTPRCWSSSVRRRWWSTASSPSGPGSRG